MFDILATPGDETLASLATDGAPGLVTHHPPLWSLDHGTQNLFSLDPILTKLCSRRGKLFSYITVLIPPSINYIFVNCGPVSQSRSVSPFSDWSPVFTLSVRTPAPAPGAANHTIRCHKAPTVPQIYRGSSLDE